MEQLSPQLMHKLVFTVLMHGLNDAQTNLALKVLTDALNSPNPQVRELAVVALADLPVTAAKRVPPLTVALDDESPRVRRRAARAIGDQGAASQPALPQLIDGLHDADPSVRRDCAGALGRIGPAASSAAFTLVQLLDEPESRSRAVAAVALKRIGRGAVPALLSGVQAVSAELRGRCATLLALIAPDDEQVTEMLRAVLTDEDEEVRARADEALGFVTTPPPVSFVRDDLPAVV
jgi:HEAT repeat protein